MGDHSWTVVDADVSGPALVRVHVVWSCHRCGIVRQTEGEVGEGAGPPAPELGECDAEVARRVLAQ